MNEHLKSLLETFSKIPTREEFVSAFKTAMDVIAKTEVKLFERVDTAQSQNTKEINRLKGDVERAVVQMREATDSTFATLKTRSMDSISALFNRLRLTDKFDSVMKGMMDDHKVKMAEMDTMISEIPSPEEFLNLIPPPVEQKEETGEDIVYKINALPTDEDEVKIAIEHIKGLEDRLEKMESKGGGHAVYASQRGAVKAYDLSASLNGVLKTFTLPAFWRVISVHTSSVPNILRETTDYTTNGGASTITFTSEIDAASTLATGQSLIIVYAEG